MSAKTPEDVDRLFGEKINAGDLEGAVALYEPGATLVMTEGDLTGTDAIREGLAPLIAGKLHLRMNVVKVVRAGDVALLYNEWSGSAVGPDIGSMYKHLDRKQDVGHFFCLLDIDAFIPVDQFRTRIDATIDRIKAGRKRPGVDEILVPGERSARSAQRNREQGISIDDATIKELRGLCAKYGVAFDLTEQAVSQTCPTS